MALRYDVKCDDCGTIHERTKTLAEYRNGEVEKDVCECGGQVHIVILNVQLSSDATPTRGFGRSSKAPKLLGVNPGHEPVNSGHLGLNADQCRRLGL